MIDLKFLDIDPDLWAYKLGLDRHSTTDQCPGCGMLQVANIPFMELDSSSGLDDTTIRYGLFAQEHICDGEDRTFNTYVEWSTSDIFSNIGTTKN